MDVLTDILKWVRVEGSTYGRAEFSAPWGVIPAHNEQMHFHLVERGSCFLLREGEVPLPLAAGDVVLMAPRLQYSLVDQLDSEPLPWEEVFSGSSCSQASPNEHSAGVCPLYHTGGGGVTTTLLCGAFQFEQGRDHPLLALLPPVMHISRESQEATPWLETTIRFLAYEACRRKQGFDIAIERLVDVLFVQIIRAWQELQPSGEGGWLGALRDQSVGTALSLIHQSPQESWTVESLGRAVGLSRSGFAARFQTLVGVPPLQYLTQWRMQMAANLLHREHKLSIGQVAHQVGYDSEASFNRAFKRTYEMTPGSWRRQQAYV